MNNHPRKIAWLLNSANNGKIKSEYESPDLANDPEELEYLSISKESIPVDIKEQIAEKLQQVNQPHV